MIKFLLLFMPLNLWAVDIKNYTLKSGQSAPAELELILQSLPVENLDPAEKKALEEFTEKYSKFHFTLSKSQLYFVVKTESAKLILSSRPQRTVQYKTYTLERLSELEKIADWSNYNPFVQYTYRSFLTDAKTLVTDPKFNSLWGQNTNNSADYTIYRRRVELVLSWIDYLAYAMASNINDEFEKLALKTLSRIERAASLLVQFSQSSKVSSDENIFELTSKQLQAKSKTESEILGKIIDPITETTLQTLPEPSNDWLPREIPNANFNGPTIIKSKDPFYTAPTELPKPTNDWILSL